MSSTESLLKEKAAFTFVEILVVGGIAIVAGTIIATNLPLLLSSTKLLDSTTDQLVARLNDAQQKAISQDRGAKWGIHLDATTAGKHSYQEFHGDSYAAGTVTDTITLDPAISFVSPAQGSTDDVIFEKVTGITSSSHIITLALSNDHSRVHYVSVLKGSGLVTRSYLGTIPSAPQNLTATGGNAQITLQWQAPVTTGGAPIDNYKIYRGASSGFETLLTAVGNVLTYTDTGRTNGTAYYYKVSAVNIVGESSQSPEASATPYNVPAAPQNLAPTAGNNKITLTWSVPASNGGSAITNYNVYRSTSSGTETLLTTIGNVLTYTDNGLTNGTTYYYKASAINGIGEGSQSSEISSVPATLPGAPTGLGGAPGNQQVTLNWSTPAYNGGSAITNYKVYRGTSSGAETLLTSGPCSNLGNVLTCTDTGLIGGTTYYYKVSAVNGMGESGLTPEASATPYGPPTAPQNLVATAGDYQVVLTWSAPSSNGGSTIANYDVYRSTSSGTETLLATIGNVLTYTDISLTGGTTYYYKVSAVNTYGEGPQSSEVSKKPLSAPSAPQNLVAITASIRVPLSWSSPASNGGSAITNYKIYRGTSAGSQPYLTTVGNVLYYLDNSGIVNGTTYYYSVSAVNAVGESALTGIISVAPVDMRLVFVSDRFAGGNIAGGDSHFNGDLSGPDSVCSSAATSAHLGGFWKVWLSDDYTTATSRLEHATVPYRLVTGATVANNWTDLTDGSIQTAINKNEFGVTDGSTLWAWTNTNSSGDRAGNGQYSNCTDWTGGYYGNYGNYGVVANTNSSWTYSSLTGCNAGSYMAVYCFEQGSGSGTVPSAPQSVAAAATSQQMALNWAAPATSDTAVTNYNIYRGTSSGGETLLATLGVVLTYTDTGLTNGTTYYYKIAAVNTAGEGAQSSEVSGTPATLPGAPAGIAATPSNSKMAVTWSAPASTGGSAVTNYNIYRGTSSGGETLLATLGNILSYSDSLSGGMVYSYYYKVSAVNAVGESALSNEAFATITTLPSAPTGLRANAWNESVQLLWDASSGGPAVTQYNIYRGAAPGGEGSTPIATVSNSGVGAYSYYDASAPRFATNYYKITAVDSAGESSFSNEVSNTYIWQNIPLQAYYPSRGFYGPPSGNLGESCNSWLSRVGYQGTASACAVYGPTGYSAPCYYSTQCVYSYGYPYTGSDIQPATYQSSLMYPTQTGILFGTTYSTQTLR